MTDHNIISSTSQTFLDIYDITNNILILKNGSTSVVLTVNAMNFGLLAEQEQDAVIYAYARLLNSINYPIQILIQSQTKDVSAYLHLLNNQAEKTPDPTKKAWINNYSKFVSDLIKERNVLDKKFYVIIPASPIEMGLEPIKSVLPGMSTYSIENEEKSVILEKAQNLLEPKRDHLISQFNAIGLYARQLDTQEIIQLFYTNYNPEATEGQQITDSRSYTTPLVQAAIQGARMDDQIIVPTPVVDPTTTPVQNNDPAPVSPAPMPSPVVPAPASITESPTITTPVAPVMPTTPAPIMPVAPVMPTTPAPIMPVAPVMPTTPAPIMPVPSAPSITPVPTPMPMVPEVTPVTADPVTPAPEMVKPEEVQNAINDTVKEMTS